MKQVRVCIGYEREYPGSRAWPNYKVKCPGCGKMTENYGEVSTTDADGDEHWMCDKCAAEVIADWPS
jgi:hypothetical protein